MCGAAVSVMPLIINGRAFEGGIRVRVRGRRDRLDLIRNKREVYRKTGREHVVNRSIVRRADHYDEVIIDAETGEVVRLANEPLSEHQGRGDAKYKKDIN